MSRHFASLLRIRVAQSRHRGTNTAPLNERGTFMGASASLTPIYIIGGAIVMIVLITLTMRSVIRRDKAMIREDMDEEHEIEAYNRRWKDQQAS
jgi:hypothetical protein